MDPFTSGLITLSIYISGYAAGVVKAGIESVPSVTRKAVRRLGMTCLQDILRIGLQAQRTPGQQGEGFMQRRIIPIAPGIAAMRLARRATGGVEAGSEAWRLRVGAPGARGKRRTGRDRHSWPERADRWRPG